LPKFTVSTHHDIEADDNEHAALLVYKELTWWPTSLYYAVKDEAGTQTDLVLNRDAADEFAKVDDIANLGS
jgi:hypothetical protein